MATQAERREATRAKLIDAAHELFAARGYERTSTEAVLAAAGVSRGALYHHFPGKQELFEAVFERVSRDAIDRTAHAASGTASPRESLLRGCFRWLREARRPEVAAILLDQGPQVLGWQRAREIESEFSLGLVMRGVQRAAQAGELDVTSVELTARILNAALAEAALATLHAPHKHRPKLVEAAIRELVEGLAPA